MPHGQATPRRAARTFNSFRVEPPPMPDCYSGTVNHPINTGRFAALALLFALSILACKKEEQAVVGVAQSARLAEQKAQAAATERDRQRAELAKAPLPTKSMYVNVHEPGQWA